MKIGQLTTAEQGTYYDVSVNQAEYKMGQQLVLTFNDWLIQWPLWDVVII